MSVASHATESVRDRLRAARSRGRRWRRARRFYRQWVGAGSLCFDVGANVGDRVKVLLSLGARVVAIEPQPECVEALRLIRTDRLTIEPVALGNAPGTAEMRISTASTLSSIADGWIRRATESGRFAAYEWPRTIAVQVSTLDALIDRYGRPDLCKIDVEGYEPEVVEGLSQPIPILSFEFTPEWYEASCAVIARLERLGFDAFNLSFGESMRLEWPRWRSGADVLESLVSLRSDPVLFGDVYARSAPDRLSSSRGRSS